MGNPTSDVNEDRSRFRKQLSQQNQPLIDELQVLVVVPNVGVLLLLKGGLIANSLRGLQLN